MRATTNSEWIRLRADIAFTRLELAALRLYRSELKARYPSPHWLYQPRIPKGRPTGGRWTGGGGGEGPDPQAGSRVRLAQAQGGRRLYTVPVQTSRGLVEVSPAQASIYAVARMQAEAGIRAARRLDPNWRPPTSLTSTIEGEIAHQLAVLRQAEQFVLSRRRGIGDNGGPPLEPDIPPRSLGELVAPEGRIIGIRAKGAQDRIRTISPEEMERIVLSLTYHGRPLELHDRYQGVWYEGVDRCVVGIRFSESFGLTLDVRDLGRDFDLQRRLTNQNLKFHTGSE